MTEHGHPPLDDRERDLLLYLTIRTICAQTGDPEETIADVLDEFCRDGRVHVYRDTTDALLCVRDDSGEDHVIVHATRDWLHAAAHAPCGDPALN